MLMICGFEILFFCILLLFLIGKFKFRYIILKFFPDHRKQLISEYPRLETGMFQISIMFYYIEYDSILFYSLQLWDE